MKTCCRGSGSLQPLVPASQPSMLGLRCLPSTLGRQAEAQLPFLSASRFAGGPVTEGSSSQTEGRTGRLPHEPRNGLLPAGSGC